MCGLCFVRSTKFGVIHSLHTKKQNYGIWMAPKQISFFFYVFRFDCRSSTTVSALSHRHTKRLHCRVSVTVQSVVHLHQSTIAQKLKPHQIICDPEAAPPLPFLPSLSHFLHI